MILPLIRFLIRGFFNRLTPLTVTKSVAFYVKTRTNKHKGKGFINYVYLRNPFASNFDKILATDEKN